MRASELDPKLLTLIPECPRCAKENFTHNFDWTILSGANTEEATKVIKKIKEIVNAEEPETNGDQNHDTINNNEETQANENQNDHISEEDQNGTKEMGEDLNETEETEEVQNEIEEKEEDQKESEETEEEVNEDATNSEDKNDDNNNENNVEKKEEHEAIDEYKADSRPVSNKSDTPAETKEENEEEYEEHLFVPQQITPSPKHSETKNSAEKSENEDKSEEEGVIEGVVNGDNEAENEDGSGKQEDYDIPALVESGNMEKLASIVLNGKGELLANRTSENPEIQAFLDNVPIYMGKIGRIHEAARGGSLRDLQAALDRRKFAIAKDDVSPNSATPLHVAIIFGNTSIVRYLAGRFPETLLVADSNGRTPLHYAATLADNSHYYNLLVHLGGDTKVEDKFGRTPEYYRTNRSEMSHKSLLGDFGETEKFADEMLTDKDNKVVANNQVDMPFFATEEGRYLASSLGDPLIKGLTEVANKRPQDPIAYLATYLYNFANTNKKRPQTQENRQTIIGSPTNQGENDAVPATIDVVTVEPDDSENGDDSAFSSTSRDEHGQSMLHFAAARAHGRNALFQLLLETEINVAFRDELYRTARDISIQANIPENTAEIDRYVLHIATKGDTDKLVELLLEGYDHVTDISDEDSTPIFEAVSNANQTETLSFLQSILTFEEKRERVHHAIRKGSIRDLNDLMADENDTGSGKLLAIGKNSYGRCSLHIAVLCQEEEIVDFIANAFKDTLRIGDNLERTALHYAMGVDKMDLLSKVLIKAGANRVAKDLKGRQPTYYYLNKSDISKLQEEEDTF